MLAGYVMVMLGYVVLCYVMYNKFKCLMMSSSVLPCRMPLPTRHKAL